MTGAVPQAGEGCEWHRPQELCPAQAAHALFTPRAPEKSEMEKPMQTSSIPDTARATRLPVTTVAAERGRKSHRSPFTHPYSQTLSCRPSVRNWSRTSKGTGACLDPCPGQRLTGHSGTTERLQVCWEALIGPVVRFGGIEWSQGP